MNAETRKSRPLERLIWIDLEMSGLNTDRDVILEVAVILTDKNLNIIDEAAPWAVRQPDSVLDNMDAWNTKTHGESGLVDRCRRSPMQEKEVEREVLRFLKKRLEKHYSPMCGNSVCQDRRFLARRMPLVEDYFHYRNFDVSSFKLAAQMWYPKIAEKIKDAKPAAHQALDDIRASIEEMREYANTMLIPLPLPDGESSGEK